MRPPREDTLPWYRQFWPWLLISLPASVVIASMVTIYIAVQTDDGL
ncbi:MAG: FixH, partial [Pseudomonadota bacterium]